MRRISSARRRVRSQDRNGWPRNLDTDRGVTRLAMGRDTPACCTAAGCTSCEGNSMKNTRRAFILAAGSTAATMSLPREVVRAADDAARNSKGGLAVDYRTAKDLVALLQARQVTAVEWLDRAIARIEAHDGKLNAVVVRDFDRARATAAEADRALARGERRPLLGVPMTVKECANVAGLPTTWGIPGTERIPVRDDAIAVARLKAAGAVVLGKTNVPLMLADWQSYNSIYGTSNNPWDLGRTPGGSSGGSAAALAAGYVSLELGNDIGGSCACPPNSSAGSVVNRHTALCPCGAWRRRARPRFRSQCRWTSPSPGPWREALAMSRSCSTLSRDLMTLRLLPTGSRCRRRAILISRISGCSWLITIRCCRPPAPCAIRSTTSRTVSQKTEPKSHGRTRSCQIFHLSAASTFNC